MSGHGWIKLCRRCAKHPNLPSFEVKGVWCDLLMLAAYEPATTTVNGIEVGVQRGQLALVVNDWAAQNDITPRRLRIILSQLSSQRMISFEPLKGQAGTLITVCNYDVYQSRDRRNGYEEQPINDSAGNRFGKTIEEEIQESPTSDVESEPVVVSRASARERAPAGADDAELAELIDQFGKDKRVGMRGMSPSAARATIDSVRSSFRAPGQLKAAIRQSLLPDQKNPVGVLFIKAQKFGVAVQVASEQANAPPRREAFLSVLENDLGQPSTSTRDYDDADFAPANPRLAYAAARSA